MIVWSNINNIIENLECGYPRVYNKNLIVKAMYLMYEMWRNQQRYKTGSASFIQVRLISSYDDHNNSIICDKVIW